MKKETDSKVTLLGHPVDVDEKESGDVVAGLLIIAAGIILFGNNVGLVPWNFWEKILRFWPLSFILVGIDVILGNSLIARFVIFIITLVMLCLIIVAGLHDVDWQYLPSLPPLLTRILELI